MFALSAPGSSPHSTASAPARRRSRALSPYCPHSYIARQLSASSLSLPAMYIAQGMLSPSTSSSAGSTLTAPPSCAPPLYSLRPGALTV